MREEGKILRDLHEQYSLWEIAEVISNSQAGLRRGAGSGFLGNRE